MKSHRECTCGFSPILIVDDNIFNLQTLKLLINNIININPDTALNGIEAVQKVTERKVQVESKLCSSGTCKLQHYQLIFMDINMPYMCGIEATQKIMKIQESNIVALNAYR